MGLIFPRNPDEAARAPKLAQAPLIYVQSLGNRDGRLHRQFAMLYAFTAMRKALQALAADGRYDGRLIRRPCRCPGAGGSDPCKHAWLVGRSASGVLLEAALGALRRAVYRE
jgi:hypothetical protein